MYLSRRFPAGGAIAAAVTLAGCGSGALSPPPTQLAAAPASTPLTTPAVTSPAVTVPAVTAAPDAPTNPAPAGVTSVDILAVARVVMSPQGNLCDTLRTSAAADVNQCPYTARLKAVINARYVRAWAGQGNPNPVLTPGNCTVARVGYNVVVSGNGGTVGLETSCDGAPPDPVWQKLVIAQNGSVLLVVGILVDAGHSGHFVPV